MWISHDRLLSKPWTFTFIYIYIYIYNIYIYIFTYICMCEISLKANVATDEEALTEMKCEHRTKK